MVAAVIVVLYYKLTKNRLNMQVQARQRQQCMEAPDTRNGSLGDGCSVNTRDVQQLLLFQPLNNSEDFLKSEIENKVVVGASKGSFLNQEHPTTSR